MSALKRVRSESFRLLWFRSKGHGRSRSMRLLEHVFGEGGNYQVSRDLARIHGLTQIAVCDDHERVTAVIWVQPFWLP